jgi:hypothetical protein
MGDPLTIIVMTNFCKGGPTGITGIKGIQDDVIRLSEATEVTSGRVRDQCRIGSLSDSTEHGLNSLCLSCARFTRNQKVFGFDLGGQCAPPDIDGD